MWEFELEFVAEEWKQVVYILGYCEQTDSEMCFILIDRGGNYLWQLFCLIKNWQKDATENLKRNLVIKK